ncbi:hypothetical protein L3Y34_007248 [Caenorhabditis briggsae]|uniref:Uncharacterized protein n=1 Tax=Caenorhabditis briggsae TaxID=6238 RepID=A0AAE9A1D7_CAEBR|nr:hypothetical protein L3Y34_007248 [Caenorhabditis briggsae]
MSSYYARSIQSQLFQALVMQTLIPVVLMYVPAGVSYSLPMFNIEAGLSTSFVIVTIDLSSCGSVTHHVHCGELSENYVM